LPEQLGLRCYAVSAHPDELVLEPSPKKNPGSSYAPTCLTALLKS